jgi:hypothetical protein
MVDPAIQRLGRPAWNALESTHRTAADPAVHARSEICC